MASIDLDSLITESRNTKTLNIDEVNTIDMVKMINEEDKIVPLAVEKELHNIACAIDRIVERLQMGGRLIYIGAGTSGRLGILDASECPPTYGVSEELVQGIIAGGHEAIFRAKEGAEDSKELGIDDLKEKNINSKDVVVGLAASGRTPYVIGGLEYANSIDAFTIAVTCNGESDLSKVAKISIAPVVGPEVVTGSTRLKSGTAQKLVLNMLSTGTMIKLGKVYGNLMVDVKPTNEKLVERAKGIIQSCTRCSRMVAEEYFEKSNRDVKIAIFMILTEKSREESIIILNENKGIITKALEAVSKGE
ncbi:N-acetylmuramic acid 6-phosphate etherase [Clostridium frigidicarnis]|uniref:N-acetylmuramic acid 6-phosphate etherase n=1 Tax=Clostridium frigidicarnis TaxID=84698 RepID=A0A1I0YJF6_9CLOT|nr:N-acetylmuramic acid 6-phosphate etherase [Clostridium frigidicarnis]SFB13454.1 N-acetylmuramic acid 6-phosphate etherase [Clostridium frigidicarnis]